MQVNEHSNPLGALKGVRMALSDSAARLRVADHLLEEVFQSRYVWMGKADRQRLRVAAATVRSELGTLELLATVHLQSSIRLLAGRIGSLEVLEALRTKRGID